MVRLESSGGKQVSRTVFWVLRCVPQILGSSSIHIIIQAIVLAGFPSGETMSGIPLI